MRSAAAFAKRIAPLALVIVSGSSGVLAAETPIAVQARDAIAADDPVSRVLARIEQMSEADLKAFYLQCSREAVHGRLSTSDIAFCSVGYERLLKWTFRGNFVELLEWRRNVGRPRVMPSPF